MQYRPRDLGDRFKLFQSGDSDALLYIFHSEQLRLFDYVMRMTGQLQRSAEIVDETLASLEMDADHVDNFQDLLILMYKSSRNLGLDIWNAETSKLENASYSEVARDLKKENSKENSKLYKLETLLRSLPPNLREVVLLRERFGFALDEVAEIMITAPSDIEVLFAQGLSSLEQGMQELATKVPQLLIDLKPFTKMLHDGPETQNLSNIINDFKKTNSISVTRTKWLFRFFFGVAAVLAWIYKEELVELSKSIRNHFNS